MSSEHVSISYVFWWRVMHSCFSSSAFLHKAHASLFVCWLLEGEAIATFWTRVNYLCILLMCHAFMLLFFCLSFCMLTCKRKQLPNMGLESTTHRQKASKSTTLLTIFFVFYGANFIDNLHLLSYTCHSIPYFFYLLKFYISSSIPFFTVMWSSH